jgi:hypothetical protein
MAIGEVGIGETRPRAARRQRLAAVWRLVRRVAAEPLTHFVLIGLVLFIAGRIYQAEADTYRIVVTQGRVQQLANAYALQFGAPPDPRTLEQLVERDVRDEMLYREGMALKLNEDDEIVRRRIVQKTQFVMQDLSPPAEPIDAQLAAYYAAHADHYVSAPRATFSQVFFSADNGGDAAAQARAAAALRSMPPGVTRAPERGDAFPDQYDFAAYEPEQVQRLFGATPFADAVYAAPVGRWSGPFRSGYGWHLVYVSARQPPARPPLSEVRDRVRADYLQDAEDAANKAALDNLARRFTVVRADLGQSP